MDTIPIEAFNNTHVSAFVDYLSKLNMDELRSAYCAIALAFTKMYRLYTEEDIDNKYNKSKIISEINQLNRLFPMDYDFILKSIDQHKDALKKSIDFIPTVTHTSIVLDDENVVVDPFMSLNQYSIDVLESIAKYPKVYRRTYMIVYHMYVDKMEY